MSREFPTEVVVSGATGFLLCPIGPVHEFYTYMAGEPVWTHQLPRVGREVEAALRRRRPDMAATFAEAEQITPENWREYLARFVDRHGPTMEVEPLSADEHESIDPVSELAERVHPGRIHVVKP